MKHAKGFNATLVKEHSLYYLRTTVIPIPSNHTIQIQQTSEGTIAAIAPTTITTQGPEHCRRKQRLLDVQQRGILGKSPQEDEQSTFLTIQDMPSSNKRVGELQENTCDTTGREQ